MHLRRKENILQPRRRRLTRIKTRLRVRFLCLRTAWLNKEEMTMLIAFKGFDKDLTCTNHGNTYQYRLGVWNEEDKANCGINGMHCAENPLDCLSYYPDWDRAVYYMVVADGDIDEDAYDSKISCTRLRLIKKLDKGEFVAHSLKYLFDHPFRKNNHLVCLNQGVAKNGIVIVRGENPVAKGAIGDVLGFAKEVRSQSEITEIGIHAVDGKEILPDTWYSINGKIRKAG